MPQTGRPGRRPLAATQRKSAAVTVKLTTQEYDRADRRATRERVTLPELMRRSLSSRLNDDDDGDDDD